MNYYIKNSTKYYDTQYFWKSEIFSDLESGTKFKALSKCFLKFCKFSNFQSNSAYTCGIFKNSNQKNINSLKEFNGIKNNSVILKDFKEIHKNLSK